MAPVTITETSLIQRKHTEDRVECTLTSNQKDLKKCSSEMLNKMSTYDEVLNDRLKFLGPIRRWEKRMGFVTPIRWTNAFFIIAFHCVAVCSFFHVFLTKGPKWQTILFGFFVGQLAGFGVTAGAHRYWCHRTYKAKLPLQLLLVFCYSIAGQNPIQQWVRDHRVHHKFSETSADPHNANRGFFFSHVGWLMMKKHPDVLREGAKIDISDILNDPIVKFHTKYFFVFKAALCWILPTLVSRYLWDESWYASIMAQPLVRYMCSLNFTWSVNSFAHLWGNKPYDRYIMPAENRGVSIVAMGEGWHNYHHTFPWDYKASELGMSNNTTTYLLDLFAKIGWAYDLKEASPTLVKAVARNRGEPRH